MEVNIFILCYNEAVLLPHTINHYKKYLPSCKITIYDNESTDNSVNIAKKLGCDVISFSSNNVMNVHIQTQIKKDCWKNIKEGWVIVIDMDEWLCVSEKDLIREKENGTTIIKGMGMNMVGKSKKCDLTDINLHNITKCYYNPWLNKHVCFLPESIQEMNYDLGAHRVRPKGKIKYSKKHYIVKHMNCLGLDNYVDRIILRRDRSKTRREKFGVGKHYNKDKKQIISEYNSLLHSRKSRDINNMVSDAWAQKVKIRYTNLNFT